MRLIKFVALASLLILSSNIFAYGTGLTSFPIEVDKNVLSAEVPLILNHGRGIGIQGRYTRKLDEIIRVEGGAGIGSGDRSSRFFVGGDFEIFPDFERQPKFALKTFLERATEFKDTVVILGVTPVVSKGLLFWGNQGHPYLALPVGIGLNNDTKKYQTRISGALGVSGNIPIEDFKKWIGQFELQIDLKNTYSGIFLSMSYPLD